MSRTPPVIRAVLSHAVAHTIGSLHHAAPAGSRLTERFARHSLRRIDW